MSELIGMFTSLRKQMRDMSKMLAMGAAAGVLMLSCMSVCIDLYSFSGMGHHHHHDHHITGLGGIPTMSNDELMAATLEDAGPRPIPRGKVRRKRGRTAMLELAKLRAGDA